MTEPVRETVLRERDMKPSAESGHETVCGNISVIVNREMAGGM